MRSRQREGEQRALRDEVGSGFYPIVQADEKPRVWGMQPALTEFVELDA